MKKIGFLGAGNMGLPLLKGAVSAFSAKDVLFLCAHEENSRRISEETGVEYVTSVSSLTKQCELLVLAVKPQVLPTVLPEVAQGLRPGQVVVSLAAGISISYLSRELGGKAKVVRAMPNTPALVGEGVTGICFSETFFSTEDRQLVERLFGGVGLVVPVAEEQMDAVTAVCGCSPAFVYLFLEALADSAVKYGISRKLAYDMVAQTVLGSAKMLLETKEHPGKLKDAVCSPGGATIEGVMALERYGFRNAVEQACDACYEKSERMKR